jgi:hypothetical protein
MLIRNAIKPTVLCAKTVTSNAFENVKETKSTGSIPISENWLYRTRMQPVVKSPSKGVFDYSEEGPDWFKIQESKLVKDHKIENSKGYDGTITVLSRISGWITVTPESQNRQNRLARHGPIDKAKKGNNYQNVSDLAPAWMQTDVPRNKSSALKKVVPDVSLRKEHKRIFLFEKDQPEKSIYSYGDFRHNVNTAEEAQKYSANVAKVPVRFLEWKEDIVKQRFDKPVSSKIGSRY